MSKEKNLPENNAPNSIARRELISKYGAYTAPVVVSLLCPTVAYGDEGMGGTVYSTSAACVADTAANSVDAYMYHGPTNTRHCMINGAAGGTRAHTVINPGPP